MIGSRGQAEGDFAVFIVIIFVIILIGFIVVKVFGGVNTGIQAQSSSIGSTAATASGSASSGFCSGFNAGIVVAIVLLYIGLFITSRYIGVNPMFFFINIFLIVVALGLAAIFGNVFDSATNNADFVVERACMPAAVYIGNRLLEFGIGAAAMILIGLFAKPGGDEVA